MIAHRPCLTIAFLCVLLPLSAHAQDSENWIADESGCLAANPAPSPNERIEWNGDCVEGYISGEGVLTWYQGYVITGRDEGNFVRGSLSGHGRVESFEGWSYEGEFPGAGILKLEDGTEVPAQTLRQNNGWHIEQVAERGL
jgi:hypothetical protein